MHGLLPKLLTVNAFWSFQRDIAHIPVPFHIHIATPVLIACVHECSHACLHGLRAGFFLCLANIRLDKFSGDKARVLVGVNNNRDVHAGLSVVEGSGRFRCLAC